MHDAGNTTFVINSYSRKCHPENWTLKEKISIAVPPQSDLKVNSIIAEEGASILFVRETIFDSPRTEIELTAALLKDL